MRLHSHLQFLYSRSTTKYVGGAAALIANVLSPGLRDYIIAARLSNEPGHRVLLEHLGLEHALR